MMTFVARPKAEFPSATAVEALLDGEGRLSVRVTAGARAEALAIEGGTLVAKVRDKPQDGAANAAVRGLIAKALDCAPSRVEMLRGATSRDKLFRILR